MALVTTDQIRDISVKSVEMFLNEKIPLSEGLAKQASALELNSEQIQRAVEATNSIAYLKILELSSDRTVEFPLCKYAEVMQGVTLPDDVSIFKMASVTQPVPSNEPSLEKVASEQTPEFNLNEQDTRNYFIKMAAHNEQELEALNDRKVTLAPELVKVANQIKADTDGLTKLAQITSGPEFAKLSALVFGEVKPHEPSVFMFKEAQLKDVNKVAALFKEAQELVFQISQKEELHRKSELVKQAFLGAALQGLGGAIGKGLGSAAAAPFKAMGKVVGGTASNVGNAAGNALRTMQGKPTISTVKKLGIGGAAALGLGAATDALMYGPGKNKDTGVSHDAWSALQRQ